MYKDYFGIEDNPFSNTPDPNYLFMSIRHQEALAHLQYGVQGSSGFVLLTGEIGTGKTTVCRTLMEQLPDNVDLALCLNPRLSEAELLATICDELAIDTSQCSPTSIKDHTDAINRHLLVGYAKGRRAVLVIDEAQNLNNDLLEQVRLLTNLETASTKLLQIILIGQPELRDIVEQEELLQLSQRITARYHLEPMGAEEIEKYIHHRLKVAGLEPGLMEPSAIVEISLRSGGIPRLINSICERTLLGAYGSNEKTIGRDLARKAADEVLGSSVDKKTALPPALGPAKGSPATWVFGSALAASLVLGALVVHSRDKPAQSPALQSASSNIEKINPERPAPALAPAQKKATTEKPRKTLATKTAAEKQAKSSALEQAPPPPVETEKPSPPAVDEAAQAIERLLARGAVVRPEKISKTKTEVAALPPETNTQTKVENKPPFDRPLSLDNLFHHPGVTGGLEAAVTRLFSLWKRKVSTFGGFNLCAEAQGQGLSCFQSKATWQVLQSLNRPALISLVNANGIRRYAVLAGLTETGASLEIDGRTINAAKDAIPALWSGDFLLLWEPPSSLRANLQLGMSGKDVVKLRESLWKISGGAAGDQKQTTAFFDDNLKKQVMAFQKSQELKEDGIVGVLTQNKLALVISPSPTPVLSPVRSVQR